MKNEYKMVVFHPYEHGEPQPYFIEAETGVDAVRKTLPNDLGKSGLVLDDNLYRVIMLESDEGIHIAIIEDIIEKEEEEEKENEN